MSITVSAPGKIHLLGEHVVVYGKPALLAAIDKRLYIKIKKLDFDHKQPISETQKDEKIIIETLEEDGLVKQAISVFKKAFLIKKILPVEISVTSQIPIGSGLGSSAALAAGVISALMRMFKKIWDPTQINELTYEVEKIAHGNPSGADNTTVVLGGLVWFRREFEFLKSIWSLPISKYKIPHFVTIDSGRPKETTKEMVSRVAYLYQIKKKIMEAVFNNQEIQTKRILLSLRSGDREELIASMKAGEQNLEKMDVVGNFAKKIIRDIEIIGGAAKICGAGGKKEGSGMLLCYHDDLKKVIDMGRKYKVSVMPIALGEEGIRLENN